MTDNEKLINWVEDFYYNIKKTSTISGISFSYYKSLRGYFKHSILLTDIKQREFTLNDYRVWERMLTNIKGSHNPVESGGLYFRYNDYADICGESAFYKTKKKFTDLKLLLETPFKFYFILNPLYIVKVYNPTSKKDETPES